MYLDIFCNELHDDLTDRLQTDVCTQPNGHKLLQPYPNTQNHQLTHRFHRSIRCGIPDSHRHQQRQKICVSTSDAASRPFSS
jgi:hypothetical protein